MADSATNTTGALPLTKHPGKEHIMLGNNSIPQNGLNGQSPAQTAQQSQPTDNQIVAAWLQSKVEHYQSEVARLEAELTAARASLKGHQIWLAEVQQRGER